MHLIIPHSCKNGKDLYKCTNNTLKYIILTLFVVTSVLFENVAVRKKNLPLLLPQTKMILRPCKKDGILL